MLCCFFFLAPRWEFECFVLKVNLSFLLRMLTVLVFGCFFPMTEMFAWISTARKQQRPDWLASLPRSRLQSSRFRCGNGDCCCLPRWWAGRMSTCRLGASCGEYGTISAKLIAVCMAFSVGHCSLKESWRRCCECGRMCCLESVCRGRIMPN